jgi:hypothetical protein
MSKFVKTLSASNAEIKEARAKMLADTTVLEVESFVQALKKEKLELQNKLANLTDLAPDNTYSLRPGSKDFDAKLWVRELHSTRMEITLKEMELEEAQAIYNEWFGADEK